MWCGKLTTIMAGVALVTTARAEDLGAHSLGRGDVGRADPNGSSGGAASAAANALVDQYLAYVGGKLGVDQTWGFRAGALDSRTSAVTLSLGYYRLWDTLPRTGDDLPGWKPPDDDLLNAATHQGSWLALAYPMLDRKLSFAADGRLDFYTSELLPDDWAFNFGFSAAGKPVESVTLTAAARNLLETNYRDTERSLEIGARFDPGKYLGIEVNTVAPLVKGVDWTMVGWHVGADIGIADVIALRGGFVADDGETYGCGGLGFLSERAILDYGMRVQVSDAKRTWHQLDLTVKF